MIPIPLLLSMMQRRPAAPPAPWGYPPPGYPPPGYPPQGYPQPGYPPTRFRGDDDDEYYGAFYGDDYAGDDYDPELDDDPEDAYLLGAADFDDSEEMLGKIHRRMSRVQRRRGRRRGKGKSTRRQDRRLARLERKRGRKAARLGLPIGGPASSVISPGRQYGSGEDLTAPPMKFVNQVERSPPSGIEVRIPMLIAGAPVGIVDVAIGAGPATVALTATTPSIPYAAFRVVGIDVIVNVKPNAEALVNVTVSNYSVSGEKNLLYSAQNVAFVGQDRGAAPAGGRNTIGGLRENQILQRTNTASVTATFRQDATNPTQAIRATVQFAAVVERIFDPAVQ